MHDFEGHNNSIQQSTRACDLYYQHQKKVERFPYKPYTFFTDKYVYGEEYTYIVSRILNEFKLSGYFNQVEYDSIVNYCLDNNVSFINANN